ncbi:divalent-cation tolerance protein CutA [Ancylobacter lacus]|nr:divalent-cation tolerance protein CutA [Ancylobacter lacus]
MPDNAYSTIVVYTTWPSALDAEAAGRAIVADGLAACANILPGLIALSRVQGEVERAEEVLMLLKTTAALAGPVAQAVRARHPYETPAILILPVAGGDAAYLGWIGEATQL